MVRYAIEFGMTPSARSRVQVGNAQSEDDDAFHFSADPSTAWASDVVAGEIVAGPDVRNVARRNLDDLKRGSNRGLVFDKAAAQRGQTFSAGCFGWRRENLKAHPSSSSRRKPL
jgi:hypothetical protein